MKTTRNRKTQLMTLVLCVALLLGCAPAAGAEEAGISAPGISFYSADEADGHFEQETETDAGEMPESPEEDLNREGEETGDPAEAFVARCYRLVLEREPEAEGLRQWAELLKSRQMTAAQVIVGFLNSDEFRGKHKTAEDLVEILYRVMLGREADEGGRQMWLKLIAKGGNMSRLINGFSQSEEFRSLCESYGIEGGALAQDDSAEPAAYSEKTADFVRRCYRAALGREADAEGLDNWCRLLAARQKTYREVAECFVFSEEMNSKNLSNEGFVRTLYRLYLDRDADAEGLVQWMQTLDAGASRSVVNKGFADSGEFGQIIASFGGGEPEANYRAVLFSESTFVGGVIQRNRGDVKLMQKMLASVRGPDGGQYSVSSFDDLVASDVLAKVEELLVKPSLEGDVSMFFFASHGDFRSKTTDLAGRLFCVRKETWVSLPELAATLSRCRGKVIVLLESCGPGAALLNYAAEDGTAQTAEEAEEAEEAYHKAFVEEVIRAFSEADPGMAVYLPGNEEAPEPGAEQGVLGSNLFLTEKFIVMVASGYLQASYSIGKDTSNLFPNKLCKGVGTSGPMPADVECGNGDGLLTVNELYQYVYKYTKKKQTPGVYPRDCEYVLFKR